MYKKPTFELRVTHVHCIDVNDGAFNGHTDDIYVKDWVSPTVWREMGLGKYENGDKRDLVPPKVLMSPQYPSTFHLVVLERDSSSPDDGIGSFNVDDHGVVKAGTAAKIVTPPNAPPNQTVLAVTGSHASYRITLVLRSANPPATD